MTVKQRQEFRIRLQRRARRKAEKQVDAAEEERNQRERELQALQDLCLRAGIKPENIEAICSNGKSPKRITRMLQAFSSVARLSFGMTLPYSRPSSVCSSRRQSHIPRHPSDGFLTTSRRHSSLYASGRHAAMASPPGGQHATTTVGDETLSLKDDIGTTTSGSVTVATTSPTRERSNSDATTYFLNRMSLLGGSSNSGRRSVRSRHSRYRRAVLGRLCGQVVLIHDSPDSSSSDITVNYNDDKDQGQGDGQGQVQVQLPVDDWSPEVDAFAYRRESRVTDTAAVSMVTVGKQENGQNEAYRVVCV